MTQDDILRLRDTAEQTRVQFKERVTKDNKYDVSCEIVALSNSHGGKIVVGIDDKTGRVNPLSYQEVQETTSLLSDLATNGIVPTTLIDIENVPVDDGVIVVATVKPGTNKPYRDSKGIVWMKQGSDKRRVFDNSELISMLMENGQFEPDSMPVKGTNANDLDDNVIRDYLLKRFRPEFEKQERSIIELSHQPIQEITSLLGSGLTPEAIMRNAGLILPDGTLTLACLVLMGKYPQRWLPAFTVRCVSFVGNSIGGSEFRDKSGGDADGNAVHIYNYIMSFLTRNLRRIQVEKDFNSQGVLEVSLSTLSEITVNSILHRTYAKQIPLRVFIFDNRIEIHSPGLLPEGVNTESIKHGVSVPRNKLLFNHGIHLLPYTGAGSGIIRALENTPGIEFDNNEMLNEFVVTIRREENDQDNEHVTDRVNDRVDLSQSIDNEKSAAIQKNPADRVGDRVGDRVDKLPYSKLNGQQKDIVQFCSMPRTAREILERVGYKYHPDSIAKFIKPLLEMGYIEMTIPNKPNSRLQKYRKVIK